MAAPHVLRTKITLPPSNARGSAVADSGDSIVVDAQKVILALDILMDIACKSRLAQWAVGKLVAACLDDEHPDELDENDKFALWFEERIQYRCSLGEWTGSGVSIWQQLKVLWGLLRRLGRS